MKRIITSFAFLFAVVTAAYAVQAYPGPVTVTQPDGTAIVIRIHGDEYLNWTTCGNSLVAKASDGYWHYASFGSDGVSNASGVRVTSTPAGDGSSVAPPSPAVAKALEMRRNAALSNAPSISIGNQNHFLILLIEFTDKSFTRTKDDFEALLSGDNYSYNGAVGSVRKYYEDVSFDKFSPVFDVYGPIKVPYTSAQCSSGTNDVNAVISACQYAHDSLGVNFADYCINSSTLVDNVFFFFPGYNQAEGGGSDCIWPHAVTYYSPFLKLDGVGIYRYGCTSEFKGVSGQTMAGIGTFCHEFGHILGLPDLYDTDYSENGSGLALQTLSLMSSGNYNNNGNTPPYFTYEEKHILGWDNGLTSLSAGVNTLEKTSANRTYYVPTPTDGEYFLFESRPAEGWDAYTNVSGMAVYHVDKSDYVMPDGATAASHWESGSMINAYASHQCMDLVETVCPESSLSYYGQIVFPGYNGVTQLTATTVPALESWSGSSTGCSITDISFNNSTGVTTMNVAEKLDGFVRSVSGEGISGVEITLTYMSAVQSVISDVSGVSVMGVAGASDTGSQKATTDENGYFEFPVPESGVYSISAFKEGYMKYSGSVTVNDAATEINIVLAEPVETATTTLQKYSQQSNVNLGFSGSWTSCYAGLRYTAEELAQYAGFLIRTISFVAANGGAGTVDGMGVQVYFDDEKQCSIECPVKLFGTVCTVDVSSANLVIPSGKSVTFAYYISNPSYSHPITLADYENPVTNANLVSTTEGYWGTTSYGNVVISASIVDQNRILDLAGFNYIPVASSYKAGDQFSFTLAQSSTNAPSTVAWTVNGEPVTDESVTLSAGIYTICATVTYEYGRVETVETRIQVAE